MIFIPWQQHTGPGGITLPVAEISGSEPGPTWLLTAGVHGDEYEGPAAIRRALGDLAHGTFAGRVIALPVANPAAYAVGSRLTPADGGNLNRAFPGEAGGTITAQWAHWLWETFMVRADRLIDLHAGGVTWEFEPVAGFYEASDLPLAAAFGLTLWQLPDTPGVLSREFRRALGPAVGMELGAGGTRDAALVEQAARGIVALVRGTGAPVVPGPVYGHTDVCGSATGEWQAACATRQEVRRGEVLGTITDWTGKPLDEVRSQGNGRVLAVRRLVSVQAGELVAVVGRSRPPE